MQSNQMYKYSTDHGTPATLSMRSSPILKSKLMHQPTILAAGTGQRQTQLKLKGILAKPARNNDLGLADASNPTNEGNLTPE